MRFIWSNRDLHKMTKIPYRVTHGTELCKHSLELLMGLNYAKRPLSYSWEGFMQADFCIICCELAL